MLPPRIGFALRPERANNKVDFSIWFTSGLGLSSEKKCQEINLYGLLSDNKIATNNKSKEITVYICTSSP